MASFNTSISFNLYTLLLSFKWPQPFRNNHKVVFIYISFAALSLAIKFHSILIMWKQLISLFPVDKRKRNTVEILDRLILCRCALESMLFYALVCCWFVCGVGVWGGRRETVYVIYYLHTFNLNFYYQFFLADSTFLTWMFVRPSVCLIYSWCW